MILKISTLESMREWNQQNLTQVAFGGIFSGHFSLHSCPKYPEGHLSWQLLPIHPLSPKNNWMSNVYQSRNLLKLTNTFASFWIWLVSQQKNNIIELSSSHVIAKLFCMTHHMTNCLSKSTDDGSLFRSSLIQTLFIIQIEIAKFEKYFLSYPKDRSFRISLPNKWFCCYFHHNQFYKRTFQ